MFIVRSFETPKDKRTAESTECRPMLPFRYCDFKSKNGTMNQYAIIIYQNK